MKKAIIIVNGEVNEFGKVVAASPATDRMIAATTGAIAALQQPTEIQVIAAGSLRSDKSYRNTPPSKIISSQQPEINVVYCPLTIQIPDTFNFPGAGVFAACKDIQARRDWVEQKLGYGFSRDKFWLGDLWLPIVLTDKGPLYGEVIGEGILPNSYQQPVDLSDQKRQSLYDLAYTLLESIEAVPSVYLLQFSLKNSDIMFDRLWPFPAAPALASLKVQEPDLFACHWRCLTHQSLTDMSILATKI